MAGRGKRNKQQTLTVLLTLLDDAYYLPEWAECVRRIGPQQVLVVDGGSKDGGVEYLESQNLPNLRVVHHPMEQVNWDYSAQLNFAMPFATEDWVLLLDADEVLWPLGRNVLDEAIAERRQGVVSLFIPRLNLWPDDRTRLDRGSVHEPQPRLWKRTSGIRWKRKVHQLQVLKGKVVVWAHPKADLCDDTFLLHRKLTAPEPLQRARHKRWLENWGEASAETGFPIPRKMPRDHGPTVPLPPEMTHWHEVLMDGRSNGRRRSTIDVQVHPRGKHRRRKGPYPQRQGFRVAVSFVGMRLGDRIMMDAPLRQHRRNCPDDYLIAIVDANDGIDLPWGIRQHFDELWWVASHDGQKWNGKRRSALARRLRDALVGANVNLFLYPPWQPKQLPRSPKYAAVKYSCFQLCRALNEVGVRPRYRLRRRERVAARRFLDSEIPGEYDALVVVHCRRIPAIECKNGDASLMRRILTYLRTQGRFAFLLIGRDDGPRKISAPDIFSIVGKDWPFDKVAALIEQAALFIGGDSGPTHAAAAVGVPVIGLDYPNDRMQPFAAPGRYLRFVKGESPKTIMAEVRRFVERIDVSRGRERGSWRKPVQEAEAHAFQARTRVTISSRTGCVTVQATRGRNMRKQP